MGLNTSQLEPLAEAVGVNANELPDRLTSTYLLAIAQKMGVNTSEIPDNLQTSILGKIVEDGQTGGIAEISTGEEMDEILANATSSDVGKAYIYAGETTDAYENHAIYIIREV